MWTPAEARPATEAIAGVSIAKMAKGEAWFVEKVAMPFWDALASVYPLLPILSKFAQPNLARRPLKPT